MQVIIILLVLFLLLYIFGKKEHYYISDWKAFFDNVQFSAQDIFARIEADLQARKVPDMQFRRQNSIQTHIFSDKREYLVISRGELVFFVCAAPFGTGFFTSWWFTEKEPDLLSKIPFVNTLLGKNRKDKTYYQLDTEAMFRSLVHSVVTSVIDEFSEAKGMRGLSELERQFTDKRR